jgi:hypothetical protein
MNSRIYRYDRVKKKHHYKVLGVFLAVFVVMGILGGLVFADIRNSSSQTIEGPGKTVSQVLSDSIQKLTIDEPTYTLELPGDWKQQTRVNNNVENSITWQSTKKGEENRQLTLYVDKAPPNKPLNRLLPVKAEGARIITTGDISENCASFTGGGTFDVSKAIHLPPAPAKWQKVDFLCNLPRVTDNEIGTGSTDGLNSTMVTGATKGKHSYFFVYTDRNIQPKSGILIDAVESFKAK